MKTKIWLILFGLFFSLSSIAQSEFFPFAPGKKTKIQETEPNMGMTVGYVPGAEKHAVKNTVSFSNIMFDRMGTYISFETSIDSDYRGNTIGMTATIHRYFYFWGGIDVLSEEGLLKDVPMSLVRKEVGITIMPLNKLTLSFGWSSGNVYSMEVGFRIPLYLHSKD